MTAAEQIIQALRDQAAAFRLAIDAVEAPILATRAATTPDERPLSRGAYKAAEDALRAVQDTAYRSIADAALIYTIHYARDHAEGDERAYLDGLCGNVDLPTPDWRLGMTAMGMLDDDVPAERMMMALVALTARFTPEWRDVRPEHGLVAGL